MTAALDPSPSRETFIRDDADFWGGLDLRALRPPVPSGAMNPQPAPLAPSSGLSEQERARRVKVMHELVEETERLGLYK